MIVAETKLNHQFRGYEFTGFWTGSRLKRGPITCQQCRSNVIDSKDGIRCHNCNRRDPLSEDEINKQWEIMKEEIDRLQLNWNDRKNYLEKDLLPEVEKQIELQWKLHNRRKRQAHWLGVTSILFSAVAGSESFYMLKHSQEPHSLRIQIMIAALTITTAILLSLKEFLKYDQRSATHLELYGLCKCIENEVKDMISHSQPPTRSAEPRIAMFKAWLVKAVGDDEAWKEKPNLDSLWD
jgi:hypothetical protein